MAEDGAGPTFESRFRARSYELDGFGHVNHAVFFNWFEQARFDTFEAGGLTGDAALGGGRAVVVVRAEADFRKEVRMGDRVVVRTRVVAGRRSSLVFHQEAVRESDGESVAEGRVVGVWLDAEGRPLRVPDAVRRALTGPDGEGRGSAPSA